MKPRCGEDINCGGECNCEDCPAKWTPKNSECQSSVYIDCDRYNTCDECPYKGPDTWPRKENLNILLGLSTKEKVMAFDSMAKRFVSAKQTLDIEIDIGYILSFYIRKYLK